jgi:hypothetical protein
MRFWICNPEWVCRIEKGGEMNKFWAVWRKDGGSAPSKRHETKDDAIAEARRLCAQTSTEYFVLETIGVVVPQTPPTLFKEL